MLLDYSISCGDIDPVAIEGLRAGIERSVVQRQQQYARLLEGARGLC